ncbi:MAG: M23 family metallopeptidase [Bacteroidales bacterium]|nr:M23 family metallopeptidase [Bacteroidales bacterium]MDY0216434.1 M23 family metallopeptidase [Bacteroidales bacterium]
MLKVKKIDWKKLNVKLRDKYRLVIMNHETLEEKVSIKLSRLNVFVIFITLSLFLIFLTTILIAYTPLREYIPGYASVGLKQDVYNLKQRADSLSRDANQKEVYLSNLMKILNDEVIDSESNYQNIGTEEQVKTEKVNVNPAALSPSAQDSIFRKEVEGQIKYFGTNISTKASSAGDQLFSDSKKSLKNIFFFTPVSGYISNVFNPTINHYGIDIVTNTNEPVRSVLDGYVIMAEWTIKTGNVIAIQHPNNLISVYKHNASLLKRQGARVEAGETIAIVGNSGKLSSGPHLHFELWHNGIPVDAREFISFKRKTANP